MKFIKMHGIGNDYVYIDCFKEKVDKPAELAKFVSDRHFGIGSDGLILVCPSESCDVKMDMYNLDGSRGEMCGNGARCVAKLAYDNGYVKKKKFLLETLGGVKEIEVHPGKDNLVETVTVNMGKPKLTSKLPEHIFVMNKDEEFVGIDVGNPHAVYFLDSLEKLKALDLEKIGSFYENHERFPNRVNSEFIYVKDKENIYMRVWERGSGETLACGTGATASAYASILKGLVLDKVHLHLTGGVLDIEFDKNSGNIYMTGNAVEVFRGEININHL